MAAEKLFGNRMLPNCAYCQRNETPESAQSCFFSRGQPRNDNSSCPYFIYDPLLRKPDVLPPIQLFDLSDFEL